MTDLVRCKGPCARNLEKTEGNFIRRVVADHRFASPKICWDGLCRRCRSAALKAQRAGYVERLRAEQAKQKTKVCGTCHEEKLIECFRMYRGTRRTYCQACDDLRIRVYRETKGYRDYLARTRRRRANAARRWNMANREHVRELERRRQRRCSPEEWAIRRKGIGALRDAVRRGDVVKPFFCSLCPRRNKKPVRAYFSRGYLRPLEAQWVCYPHFAALIRGREIRDDLDGDDALSISHKEWQEFHEEHLELAEEEYGAPDPEYAAEVERYKKLFRPIVFSGRRQPRYADLMLLQSTGGD